MRLRYRLKIFDHIAIFVLIAATYTPFALVTLEGTVGWIIFAVAWGIALAGTVLKIFFTGRYKTLSTIMYVGMGWIIIFAIKPLLENFSTEGLLWLLGGGVAYTIGAILYSISKINYNHAWFHIFVLLGSLCHFIAIYLYVKP
jgi:hemolysin III